MKAANKQSGTLRSMRPFFVALFLIAATAVADAQGFPRDLPGITVTGRATLAARADVVYVSELLVSAPGTNDDIDRASAAVVTLLQSAGARDAAAATYVGDDDRTGRLLTGTIHAPARAILLEIARGVSDAVGRYPGTLLQRSTALVGLLRCEDVEGRLQAAALKDARARAGRLASGADVQLGTPTIITPGNLPGFAFPCRPSRTLAQYSAEANALPDDGNVTFGLFVNVTYPIVAR
jgi:uncharacterized protein YggE